MIEDLWYKNAVFYSLDLKSFMDADGNGIGDFEGLNRRLDYLHSMGIDAIWLAPVQPSPNRDNGYDISDYYGVNPCFGSSGDFVEFIHAASERGLRVLLDLVVNHTSDEHPWFQEARKSKDSPYRDWYLWSKERPDDWDKGMVFPGIQDSTWDYDEQAGEYYFHRFFEFQPDLNLNNPEVREEIRRIMGYWLELGVAGFRVDAVPFVIEHTSTSELRVDLKFEYLTEMRRFTQWRQGDAILFGEANVAPDESKQYLGEHGGLQMMFNFYVNQYLFYALATREVEPLKQALLATQDIPVSAQWGQFLRNHDELDLGRLSDEERQKVFEQFAPDPEMRLFDRGIRRRLAPMLGDRQRLELAYSLMFALPGSPVLRYGDEIGMGEDLSLKGRDAVRTPMQWANEPNGGFSTAEKTYYPVVSSGTYSYENVNVEQQRRDPHSLLNWMTGMIRLRHECPEIGWGKWVLLEIDNPYVLGMRFDWRGNCVVVLHNFSTELVDAKFHLQKMSDDRLADLMVNEELRASESGRHTVSLAPNGYRWFRAGGLNYAAFRNRE